MSPSPRVRCLLAWFYLLTYLQPIHSHKFPQLPTKDESRIEQLTIKSKEEIKVCLRFRAARNAVGTTIRRRVRFGKWKIPLSFHITPSLYFNTHIDCDGENKIRKNSKKQKRQCCYWLLTLLYIFFLNMRDTGETRERPPSPPTCGLFLCIGKSCHLLWNIMPCDAQSYTAVNPT
jgi:hypothetical protein